MAVKNVSVDFWQTFYTELKDAFKKSLPKSYEQSEKYRVTWESPGGWEDFCLFRHESAHIAVLLTRLKVVCVFLFFF